MNNKVDSKIEKHVVVCVHGTFAAAEDDYGRAWWQKNGVIANALNKHRALRPHFECSARCFHWSGLNSLHAREEAAEDLYRFLQTLEKTKTPYHLLGHSHGGSVIWAMLRRVSANPSMDLPNLVSWITVGTPFLALKRTMIGRITGSLLRAVAFILLLTLAATSIWYWIDPSAVKHVPGVSVNGIVGAWCVLAYTLLYVISKALDHKPDPGSVIVNTERRELLEKFVSKWFGLWSADDEAIAALRTALNGRMAPLPKRPWHQKFSLQKNPLWVRTFFSVPSAALWNLLLRPLGNRFMRGTLRSSSLGIDRPGVVATAVAPWPRIFGNQAHFPALPHAIESKLQINSDAALSKSTPALRRMLTDVSVGIDANAALSPETIELLPAALIHTSYFENAMVLEFIFRWLLIEKGASRLSTQKIMAKNYFHTFLKERERLVKSLLPPP